MKILFSPVGMTDPVSEEKDPKTKEMVAVHEGALLQICRHERPDVVYLYFSQDTCTLEAQDHRYTGGLELLKQDLGIQFAVEIIERPDLTEVHLFDAFLQEFRGILADLREKNPGAELLVNVSSGTPAMKSALQILASASELNLIPKQVTTWNYRPNHMRDCNIQQEWPHNADRAPDAPPRVTVSANQNLLYEFNRKILIKLIDEYDYHAAKTVSMQMRSMLPEAFLELLDAAIDRSDAKFEEAQQRFRACDKADLMPAVDLEIPVAEYYLLLDIYVKKEKYTDFLRAMTPIFLEMLIAAIRHSLHLDLTQYMKPGKREWDESKQDLQDMVQEGLFDELPENHPERKPRKFRHPVIRSYVLSSHLSCIIENKGGSGTALVRDTLKLRNDVEEQIRNFAAHTMNGVTEDEVKRECGMTPQELIAFIRDYIRNYTDIPLSDEFLQSYQTMNDKLKSYL